MLGKLIVDGTPEESIPFDNPDKRNLVREVSMKVTTRSFVTVPSKLCQLSSANGGRYLCY